ncbi:MAG: CDP-alcohol phosphatidyltransferase family protein [Haloarculaceae archaeon]
MTETTANGPRRVALEAGGWFVAAGAFLAGLGVLVAESDGATPPVTPVVVVVTLWTVLAAYLVVTVSATPDGRADGTLGLANALTVARGGLYAVVAAFVTVAPAGRLAWVPAVCYGVGVVLDRLDGSVARTIGRETTLGRRLDMAFDTFGFVAAPLLAVAWGQLPVYYLSLSAARYVYRAGKYQRRLRGLPLYDRPESDLGRYLAGGQMVFLTLVMTPVVPPEPVALVAPLALAPSLCVFGRDYLFVSGRLATGD